MFLTGNEFSPCGFERYVLVIIIISHLGGFKRCVPRVLMLPVLFLWSGVEYHMLVSQGTLILDPGLDKC